MFLLPYGPGHSRRDVLCMVKCGQAIRVRASASVKIGQHSRAKFVGITTKP